MSEETTTAGELVERLYRGEFDNRAYIAELLRMAAELVEMGGDRDDSASWRAVDALVELKAINQGYELPGIDDRTGRGGKLDIKPPRR